MPDYALPVDQPQFDAMGNPMPTNASPDYTGINPAIGKLFGTGGEERYQTWPERMIRSGSTIAGDVYSGAVPITDDSGHTSQPVIERVQDMAGLAGMSSIPLAEKGALGAIGGKFYSTLENTIAGSKVQKATPEQWTSYLKNQPGVKPEELEFSLTGLGDKVLTKEQLAQHVADNGIKFGEVWKGVNNPEALTAKKAFEDYGKELGDKYDVNPLQNIAMYRKIKNIPDEEINKYVELQQKYHDLNEGPKPKYSSYQLPGGENYRELLMTVPDKTDAIKNAIAQEHMKKNYADLSNQMQSVVDNVYYNKIKDNTNENYHSSHWSEPNVLAHIRMNDREIPGVGKTLHVEEIQSDWHQAGRKQGYNLSPAELDAAKTRAKELDDKKIDQKLTPDEKLEYNNLQNKLTASTVPNAPFKKTWDELALKRVLSEAATKGYDAVSWTPGEAQAARYDLSKTLDHVEYSPKSKTLIAYDKNGNEAMQHRDVAPEKLSDYIGKEAAEKIINSPSKKNGEYHTLENADLKVGGEGMKAFYDTMLPAKANALIKKMGGKVEYHDLPMSYDPKKPPKSLDEVTDVNLKIPIIKITPQMRENIANKGFPLYSSGVPTFSHVDNDPWNSKIKLVPVKENPFL